MRTIHKVEITPTSVVLDGRLLPFRESGEALLTEVYRQRVGDWPKFFKMDLLSKVGFLAAELLLEAEGDRHRGGSDRAVILSGRSGSLCDDRDYQQMIADPDDFYPSPSVFVYTLPNIVTGEIAIRNGWHGETMYYALEEYDPAALAAYATLAFTDPQTRSALCGWVECPAHEDFYANVEIIER